MTVGEFLDDATKQLRAAGIDTAHLDTLILLEDALRLDRASILAHPEADIIKTTEVELNNKIAQRALSTPLAYIRGKVEFYGRGFTVRPGVLVPRPETEVMIELLKTTRFGSQPDIIPLRIADIGTGSGCLGITAALEMPGSHIDLYDIDAAALGLAAHNAKTHQVRASVFHEDLLCQAVRRRYDVILTNLPYVPTHYPINNAARHEPKLALFAGEDGLDAYRRLWKEISRLEWQPSYIFTESLSSQHPELAAFAKAAGYHLERSKDLIQQFAPGPSFAR